jgi:ankyrin repeat protein
MAEWLLRHGAGPNTTAGNVWKRDADLSLYQLALRQGREEMAELLARFGARRDPLPIGEEERFVQACLAMDGMRVRTMLEQHPEYLKSHQALFAAVHHGRVEVVRFLLDRGFSPDLEKADHPGQRALHLAAAQDQVECAKVLLERGGEVDARDSVYQSTPLGWAVWFGNTGMIELLAPLSRDLWPLVYTGQAARVTELIEAEPALARSSNEAGETLLMWLPEEDDTAVAMARLLMAHGADASARNPQGASAADLAERRGLVSAAALLRNG